MDSHCLTVPWKFKLYSAFDPSIQQNSLIRGLMCSYRLTYTDQILYQLHNTAVRRSFAVISSFYFSTACLADNTQGEIQKKMLFVPFCLTQSARVATLSPRHPEAPDGNGQINSFQSACLFLLHISLYLYEDDTVVCFAFFTVMAPGCSFTYNSHSSASLLFSVFSSSCFPCCILKAGHNWVQAEIACSEYVCVCARERHLCFTLHHKVHTDVN